MPNFKSACMTDEYLDHMLKYNLFYVPNNEVTMTILKNPSIKKKEIYILFEKAVKVYDSSVLTGCDENHMPNKEWLINVYHFLNPRDEMF